MRKVGWALSAVVLFIVLSGCGSLFGEKKTDDVVFWDTAILQNVTRITDDGLSKDWATVSPDGTKMLYCESTKSVESAYYGEVYDYWNIMLLRNVNVPAKTPLINDYAYAPTWYNDNNKFVYVVRENNNNRIVRTAAAGGGKTYVTRNAVGSLDSRPSVRGEAILLDTYVNGKRQLVSMKDNGTEITMLGDGQSPSWHPTEPKFVFLRREAPDRPLAIYEMDMASIQVTQLYSDPDGYSCMMPRYTADGEYIVFQKGAETVAVGTVVGKMLKKLTRTSTSKKWQIFTMKADGTTLSPITFGNVNSYSPSVDISNNIYFVSDASGKTEIYRARVNLE